MNKKSRQKLKYNEKKFLNKKLLRWNKKHFSSILNGFQSNKQHNVFLKGGGPTLIDDLVQKMSQAQS